MTSRCPECKGDCRDDHKSWCEHADLSCPHPFHDSSPPEQQETSERGEPETWTIWRWPASEFAHERGWQVATVGEDIPSAAEMVEVTRLSALAQERERRQRVEKERARAERHIESTQQWYAERWERLKDLVKEHGIWDKAATVMANGTAEVTEPPTYAQQLNIAKHRAEAAEAEARTERERREEAERSYQRQLETAWAAESDNCQRAEAAEARLEEAERDYDEATQELATELAEERTYLASLQERVEELERVLRQTTSDLREGIIPGAEKEARPWVSRELWRIHCRLRSALSTPDAKEEKR